MGCLMALQSISPEKLFLALGALEGSLFDVYEIVPSQMFLAAKTPFTNGTGKTGGVLLDWNRDNYW